MKTTSTPLGAAWLLGRRLDDPVVVAFVQEHNGREVVEENNGAGQIIFDREGFDIILSLREGAFSLNYLRFLSPSYCHDKGLVPYGGELIEGLRFPCDGDSVRRRLGEPSRRERGTRHFDEYEIGGYMFQFVYRRGDECVQFVEVEALPKHSDWRSGGVSLQSRLLQLTGTTRAHWKDRYNVYLTVFGDLVTIFPDQFSDEGVVIDVLLFRTQAFYTFITMGMSDAPMPDGESAERRAELELHADVPAKEYCDRLVQDASLPFVDRCAIGHGDTIAWNAPVKSGSRLTADLIIYSPFRTHREWDLRVEGESVVVLCCVPITQEELEYKRGNGVDRLFEVFDARGVSCVVDPGRSSAVSVG
jgi:hypothetical protein